MEVDDPVIFEWSGHFRTDPLDRHMVEMASMRGFAAAPGPPQLFGNAGIEHMEKYDLFCIAHSNHPLLMYYMCVVGTVQQRDNWHA